MLGGPKKILCLKVFEGSLGVGGCSGHRVTRHTLAALIVDGLVEEPCICS